jgi:L-ascorbate metabolism protein UlaG (beta-lactamase superfamily)
VVAAARDGGDVVETDAGPIRITPLHHGSLQLQIRGETIYVDPTVDAGIERRPKAAAIFVTHIHGDHFDAKAIAALADRNTVIIAPAEVAEQLPELRAQIRVVSNGQVTASKAMIVPSLPALGVEAVAMYNLQRGPGPGKVFHAKGRGNGYVIDWGGRRIYVSGDTECTPEMKALRDIDVALVCMNLPYTMPPAEAIACIEAFRPKVVYPYHYRGSDPAEVARAFTDDAIEVRLRDWYR